MRQSIRSSSNHESGTSPSCGIDRELPEEDPSAALTWAVETLGRQLNPAHAGTSSPGIGEGTSHRHRLAHRTDIGKCASEPGARNPVNDHQIAALEGSDLVSNRAIRTCPPSAALDADLGDVARRESVELVKTRRRPMRSDSARHRQRCHHHSLAPGGRRPTQNQQAGVRLGQPPPPLGGGDAASIEVQFGSLAAGEHSMLRGCKLGNGAYGVVQHVADGTQGVSWPRSGTPPIGDRRGGISVRPAAGRIRRPVDRVRLVGLRANAAGD